MLYGYCRITASLEEITDVMSPSAAVIHPLSFAAIVFSCSLLQYFSFLRIFKVTAMSSCGQEMCILEGASPADEVAEGRTLCCGRLLVLVCLPVCLTVWTGRVMRRPPSPTSYTSHWLTARQQHKDTHGNQWGHKDTYGQMHRKLQRLGLDFSFLTVLRMNVICSTKHLELGRAVLLCVMVQVNGGQSNGLNGVGLVCSTAARLHLNVMLSVVCNNIHI